MEEMEVMDLTVRMVKTGEMPQDFMLERTERMELTEEMEVNLQEVQMVEMEASYKL
jgi:hypothetical protein